MRIRDLAVETASALDANRGRSLLTILGIVIGITAVISMTALIGGIKQSLIGELGLNQARMVNIYAFVERDITLDDLERLKELMPEYETLVGTGSAGGTAKSDEKSFEATVTGTLPEYFRVMGIKFIEGSSFTDEDQERGNLVAVLDQGAVRKLYGSNDKNVTGRTILLNEVSYQVVGVVESEAGMGDFGTVYLPFSTCAARVSGSWSVGNIIGLATEEADLSTIADTTMAKLTEYFQVSEDTAEDTFFIYTMQSMIDEVNTMVGSFQLIMTAVASVSLLVGGIGIMNMMLTNVTERIREIGLRKALGARRSDITMQFLLEAICLCLAGGIIGIALGYVCAYALAGVAGSSLSTGMGFGGSEIKPVIDMSSVLMATGICVLIGVVFGYYPASRAAKLDPVESLHYQ